MKLRSSRRSTRLSDLRAKKPASTCTNEAGVSSQLPSSCNRPFVSRSVRKRHRELTHLNSNEIRVYQLRSGRFPVESIEHKSALSLGVSQSAHSKLGPASPKLPSVVRDNDSYRGRPGKIAGPSTILRECGICIENKGKYVLSHPPCLPPTHEQVKTPIPSSRLPP